MPNECNSGESRSSELKMEIVTIIDVAIALDRLNLPVPSRSEMEAISAVCRDQFRAALQACIDGNDVDGTQRSLLINVFFSLSPKVADALKHVGKVLSSEDLVRIALYRPTRFHSAITIVLQRGHEKRAEALSYLDHLVNHRPWQQEVLEGKPSACAVRVPDHNEPELPSPPPVPDPGAEDGLSTEKKRAFRSHHVYGSDYALCFNVSSSPDGTPSVMVDASSVISSGSYDWDNALHIMLDVREVGSVLAVFRKRRKEVEFRSHGRRRDKSFALVNQGGHFFCRVSAGVSKKPVRSVKILPHDALKVSLIFMEQLLLAYKHLPSNEVMALAMAVNEVNDHAAQ